MKKINTLIMAATCALLMAGCTTGTHIVMGNKRQPIKPEDVTIYQSAPAHFEAVGIVNSTTPGRFQFNMDSAVQELKVQAAKIGANGIIIGAVNPGSSSVGFGSGSGFSSGGASFYGSGVSSSSSGIQLSGTAIYVSPKYACLSK